MIKATVGRVVWVRRNESLDHAQPEVAIIVAVNAPASINVRGWNKLGTPFTLLDLHLLQHEDANQTPPYPYAEWMPYQKSVAAGDIPPVKHVI
jgi:hypothetical protein